jgi:hypothetical protein
MSSTRSFPNLHPEFGAKCSRRTYIGVALIGHEQDAHLVDFYARLHFPLASNVLVLHRISSIHLVRRLALEAAYARAG